MESSKPVAILQNDCHLQTVSWLGATSRRMVMLRKTMIALLAVAAVGLAAPTMGLARGGGGGGGRGGGGGGPRGGGGRFAPRRLARRAPRSHPRRRHTSL